MKKLCMILSLALILCFMVGCQDKEVMAEFEEFKAQAEVEEQNLELVRNAHLAWEKRDYRLIRNSYARDLASYSPANSKQTNDLERLIMRAETFYVAFPDYNITIEEIIAKGDKVALRAIVRGIHEEEYKGIQATGNKIEISQTVFFRIDNGKIVEQRQEIDMLGFMQQLGMELKPKEGEK